MICAETSSKMHFVWNLDIGEADVYLCLQGSPQSTPGEILFLIW